MWQQILTAASAFSATNLDDILILTLLFSRLDQRLRLHHVVSGQVLGFSALVLLSLAPLLGRSLFPLPWLGLLGLLPIGLGVSGLIEMLESSRGMAAGLPSGKEENVAPLLPSLPAGGGSLAPVLAVAALTAANGSDNFGVYLPLFARAATGELLLMLLTFAVGLALWCLLAWWFTRIEGIADVLRRWGSRLCPAVLIALGVVVLFESDALHDPPLALIALLCLAVMAASLLRPLEAPIIAPESLATAASDDQRP